CQSARADRMPASFQAARGVNRQWPVESGFSIHRSFAPFAWRKESQIFRSNNFKRGEGVVNLGKVNSLRRSLPHLISPGCSDPGGRKGGEDIPFPQAQGSCPLPYSRQADVGFLAREHQACRSISDRSAIVETER